jgi:ribonucleoside-diphosphate reductase alpha chain
MEQVLAPGGICCLGSMNLTQYVTELGEFDFDKFKKYIPYMVRFLDNVNSYSDAPLPEYVDSMRNKRRIGLGVMGWGSALFMMRTKFGSQKAHEIRDKIMKTLAKTAYESSIDLAIEKGMFTYCEPEKHAEAIFIKSLGLSDEYLNKLKKTGIRNAALLSIQPNGNTGILANMVSGGIEPIFMPEYIRTTIVNSIPADMIEFTPKFYEGEFKETDKFKFAYEGDTQILICKHNGVTYKIDKNRGLVKEVICKDYSVDWLETRGLYDQTAEWNVSALTNLSADDHINDLIGFARYLDSACSKTVNCPNDYPFEDFKAVYLNAYNSGVVKGVTTYRSGTMAAVLSAKETKDNGYDEEVIVDTVKMANSSEASMKILRAEGRKWYLTVVWNETKTRPQALFVYTNSHEKTVTTHDAIDALLRLARFKGIKEEYISGVENKIASDSNATKLTRVISLLLRHGVLIKNIVATLDKIDNVFVGSFIFQIRKYLSGFIKDGDKVENENCQSCGSDKVVYQEGCKICLSCGSSKCG